MLDHIFPGTSEMAQRMRQFDWSKSPLGPVEQWPQSLRTLVSICLDCAFPIVIWWGPALAILYNDEYRAMLGSKHPAALGEPGAKVWAEIWDVIAPMLSHVVEHAEATRSRDLLLHIDRQGYPEEAYFSFSYSPIHDEEGRIGGVFCPVIETTDKVIGERRLRTLRDLAAKSKGAESEMIAYQSAADVLAANPYDVPFALVYRIDRDHSIAVLEATAGIQPGATAAPRSVALPTGIGAAPGTWSLDTVAQSGTTVLLSDLSSRFDALPTGAWKVRPHSAMILPILLPGHDLPRAILVAAVSAMRALDEDHRTFFGLVATQIASGLADAQAIEEERRRAEALAEIDRAKTAFFSNVSHEFRTPLTLMLGPIEDELRENPAVRGRLDVAHRNSLRLLKLVNTLLDFSRIEAGRIDANYEPVDLAAFTVELASVFRSAIEKAGLRLVVECPPLPGPEAGIEPVFVDRDMWEKIVLNLLSNAFKFTFAGEISVTLRGRDDRVELSVSDTGVGIPEADLPKVFQRFHRVKNARARTHEGTGIGLALVQELVRLHGGEVGVQSQEGRGTTFTVSIPSGHAHLPADHINAARQLASTALGALPYVEEALRWLPDSDDCPAESVPVFEAVSGGFRAAPDPKTTMPVRILVVDDNADMRQYLRHLLERQYMVDVVTDGQAALERIHLNAPDLILTDVMMPRMDGFALLAAIRADERTRSLPVVIVSARAGEESRIEGLQAGADAYLVKPFSARDLLACVGSQLELARLRREGEQALRYRSQQYETLLNQAPLGVYLVSADFRIIEVNPVALPAFGAIPGGIIGRDLDEILHIIWEKAYADEMVQIFRHTLETGEPYFTPERAEFRIDRGITEYYEWRLDRITLPDGGYGVVCYFRDISAIVSARQQIAASEALAQRQMERAEAARNEAQQRLEQSIKVRTFSRELAKAVTLEEVAGTVCKWARELVAADGAAFIQREGDLVHYIAEDAIGRLWAGQKFSIGACISGWAILNRESAAIPDIYADARVPINAYRTTFVKALLMVPVRETNRADAEGPRAAVGVYWAQNHNASEDEVRMLAAVADAASIAFDRSRLLANAEEAKRSAERESRAKDEFLAMLGHELRNPLGALASAARVLDLKGRPPVDEARARRIISRQIDHLRRLVDDLLDVSRLTTAKVRLSRRPLDFAAVVRSAVEALRARGVMDRHQVSFDGESVWVEGDETRLEQIVTNLIGNALKFTAPGGTISVNVGREGPAAVLAVRDTGIGIPAESLEKIFDLFVQGQQTLERADGGLGIGLTLVRRLVELHGGTVTAFSDGPSRGSCFTVFLPGIAVESGSVVQPATTSVPSRSRRLLIVEDNDDAREMLRIALEQEGHEIYEAADGPTGIEAALTIQPDIALIDVGLPLLDGYEVARRIRERTEGERIYLVALTGYGQPEDRHRAEQAGFDEHVVKPVDPVSLAQTLAKAGRHARLS